MTYSIYEYAYSKAKEHYNNAQIALIKDIEKQFPNTSFDTVFATSQRALQLHLASIDFATKVWAGNLPYEKAESFLASQFTEFPAQIITQAFSSAYTYTR